MNLAGTQFGAIRGIMILQVTDGVRRIIQAQEQTLPNDGRKKVSNEIPLKNGVQYWKSEF